MSETIITKICPRCKENKSLLEFYKDQSRKSNHRAYCKNCCSAYNKTTEYKAATKRYHQSEKGKTYKKYYRQTKKHKATQKRYHIRHPEHHKAQNAANYAIRTGRLIAPRFLLCHYCPKPAQEYHHWQGYKPEYWLDVVPVCISCHNKQSL